MALISLNADDNKHYKEPTPHLLNKLSLSCRRAPKLPVSFLKIALLSKLEIESFKTQISHRKVPSCFAGFPPCVRGLQA